MRRRRRRRRSAVLAVLLILCLALQVIVGILLVSRYKDSKKPVYEYISMTEEVSAKAYVWLSQIEGTDITYEDVKECIGDFNLELVKTPAREKGVYLRVIADGAYEYCASQAQTGFEKAYRMTVMKRLSASGFEGEINEALVENLMRESYEVSVSEYLKGQDISVMPSLEELKERYEGEVKDDAK